MVFHVLLYSVKIRRAGGIWGLLNSPLNISVLLKASPMFFFSLCVHVLLLMVGKMLQRVLE